MLTERDSAWVDVVDDLRWIDGGKRFTWISERDGWRHLYVVSRDGSSARLVTPGAFDLHNPASAFGAGVRRRRGLGGGMGLLHGLARQSRPSSTSTARGSTARASRSASRRATSPATTATRSRPTAAGPSILSRRSARRRPWTSSGCRSTSRSGPLVRQPSGSARPWPGSGAGRRSSSRWTRATGSSSTRWVMKPPGFDSTRRYPVLFHVYGEPAGQTVLDQWDGGTYLWHLMLTQHGLCGGVGGQPRHAGAARAAPSGRRSTADRPGQLGRPGGGGAHDAAAGAGWTRPGSGSGAGAAAARPRST